MANYVAPAVYPYVDATTALVSADYNPVIAALVDLGASGGRVHALETSGVRSVVVSTGSEARPSADVVLWVAPTGVTPANALDTDLVFMPQGFVGGSVTAATTAAATVTGVRRSTAAVTASIAAAVTATGTTAAVASATVTASASVAATKADTAAASPSITSAATVTAGSGLLFSDTFNRANGAVGNGWTFPAGGSGTITSNVVTFAGWDGYGRVTQSALPKNVSVRAVFAGTLQVFQGIFLGQTTGGSGVRLLNAGGTWVIGDSADYGVSDTNVAFSNTPSTPYTTLRLDLTSGTTITAYINGTLVHTATLTALGITLSASGSSVFQCGYAGEAGRTGIDTFEVYST